MFTLPIVCNSLTVALASTFKRNSLHYWTMKNIRPSLPPIMIATLSSCAQLERDNISFRLQSGRKRYIEKGGKLGRKVGSVKTAEQMKAEYREVISLLRKGYSILLQSKAWQCLVAFFVHKQLLRLIFRSCEHLFPCVTLW